MCGLKSKLLNNDYCDIINQYDFFSFCETKTDKYDVLDLPVNFSYYAKHRNKFERKSGGIVIAFKKIFDKHLKFLDTDSDYVQWFEISPELTGLRVNILVGGVYIPP